jgi:hypothetical protein
MPRHLLTTLLLLALAVAALPPLLVHMPPLVDYPDHFARVWLISRGATLEPVSHMYAVDWTATQTNMGIELAAAVLGPLVPPEILMPLLLATAVLLPPMGAVALNRTVFGTWHPWQVGFAFLGFAGTLLAGFLNFQIAVGLALFAASTDPWAARRLSPWGACVWRAVMAAALLPVHVFGVVFYAVLIFSLNLGPHFTGLVKQQTVRRLGLALAAGMATTIPVALFILLAPSLPGAHVPDAGNLFGTLGPVDDTIWKVLRGKVAILLAPVYAYHVPTEVLLAAALSLPLVAALALGRLQIHTGLLIGAAFCGTLAIVCPGRIAGSGPIDVRFSIMAALTLAAALRPEFSLAVGGVRRGEITVAVWLFTMVVARTVWIGGIWEVRSRADTGAVERALAHVPAGAAVLPMVHLPSRADRKAFAPLGRYVFGTTEAFAHLHALAVPERRAYTILYAERGKHTLRVLPPWDEVHPSGDHLNPSIHALLAPADKLPRSISFVRPWRERFDYVLLVNADLPDAAGPLGPVPGLELLNDEGFARLYRIYRHPFSPDGPAVNY